MSVNSAPPTFDASIDWMLIELRKPKCGTFLWNVIGSIVIFVVSMISKLVLRVLNKTYSYNDSKFSAILANKPAGVPLITVSNHHSCFDDPGIWGSLSFRILCNRKKMRWSLAAHDICFTQTFHSYFFMLGKCIPVIRGHGVYQDAIDFMLERMKEGEWVHIFPEGRVNVQREYIRLKWGVGRLVYESPVTPIVVPIWHLGMEEILPNTPPYIFRAGKTMTLNYGNPIDFTSILLKLRTENASAEVARKVITDKIEEELLQLKRKTEELHKKNRCS